MMSSTRIERIPLRAVVAALIGALFASCLPAGAQIDPPNIVVVMVDDADRAAVEAMPAIDELIADQGMTFERFYTSQPLCCPSRASFLLGEYPHNHGVLANSGKHGGFTRFRKRGHERRTVARVMRESGYKTSLFGKYLNGYGRDGSPKHVPKYWTRWLATMTNDYYGYPLNSDGRIERYGKRRNDYQTTVLDAEARRWIRRRAGNVPFFAFISMRAPHENHTEPPSHRNEFAGQDAPARLKPSYDEADVSDKPARLQLGHLTAEEKREIDRLWRVRMRMLLAVDDHVRRLVTDLTDTGEINNTYIFVLSDNGWMQGEHRHAGGKGVVYEESTHMPLLVRGPGILPGSTTSELVSMIDLFATFAELAGNPQPRDGRSITGLLTGTALDWRDQLLLESSTDDYRAVVTDRYKFVRHRNGERELYDLQADPYELDSLHASADPALIDVLDTKLDALVGCAADGCRTADGGP